jgi:hypothetical protein
MTAVDHGSLDPRLNAARQVAFIFAGDLAVSEKTSRHRAKLLYQPPRATPSQRGAVHL